MISWFTMILTGISFVLFALTGWSGFALTTVVLFMLCFAAPVFDILVLLGKSPGD